MPEVKVISKLDVPDTLILLPLPTLLNKNFGRVVFFSKIISVESIPTLLKK